MLYSKAWQELFGGELWAISTITTLQRGWEGFAIYPGVRSQDQEIWLRLMSGSQSEASGYSGYSAATEWPQGNRH